MTDSYKELRAALDHHRLVYDFWFVEKDHLLFEDAAEGYYHGIDPEDQALIKACHPKAIRALLDERDSLREALQEHVDAHAVPSTQCKERAAYEKAIAALTQQEQV